MEEEFYATIKLKHTGEEIFAKVAVEEQEEDIKLLVVSPIIVEEIRTRGNKSGYKFEPWLKTTTSSMYIINLSDVLTLSESSDLEMILYYEDYVSKMHKTNYSELDRKMGYLGTVEETKKSLEDLFNKSLD